ncbi:MAG: hypothetical protein ABSF24_06105 [Candidatus Bathyarchaeia archaeon]|jgi:hypothetical protein
MSHKAEMPDLFVFVEVADDYGYALHVDYAVAVPISFGSKSGLFRLVWKDARRYAREIFLARP